MTTQQNKNYALLVGVDDYRTFDSQGLMDLPGSVNDVLAWRSALLRRGFAAENIRVLVSPAAAGAPQSARVPGAAAATRENIERGLEWLAEQLADRDQTAGVFTFSGHGDLDEHGAPVLCPADTQGNEEHLANVLHLEHAIHKLHRNATVVLDCCHSGPVAPGHAQAIVRSAQGPAIPAGGAVVLSLRGRSATSLHKDVYKARTPEARVFSATSLGGVAFQTELGGRFHGALTWALTSLLGQWKSTPGTPPSMTLSCRTAHTHVESLFAAIGLPQSSAMYGTSVQDDNIARRIPFLGRGIEGIVSEAPDGPRVALQFPVDLKVWIGTEIHLPDIKETGVVSALSYTPPAGYERNREYWRVGEKFLSDIAAGARTLYFSVDGSSSPPRWDDITTSPPYPLFSMDLIPEWRDSSPPSGAGYYSNDADPPVAVFFALVPPTAPGASWRGTITWYRVLPPGADARTPVFDSRGRTLQLQDRPPAGTDGLHWQQVVLGPVAL